MPLPTEFWHKLTQRSDKELYEMVTHAQDYLPEALEAIKGELNRRGLSHEQTAELEAVAQAQIIREEDKAREPLGWIVRILMLLMVWPLIFVFYYGLTGQKRKAKECVIWVCYGLLLYLILFLLRSL